MTRTELILISAGEALVLVLVLSIALNQIGGRLTTISQGLTTLAGALTSVEAQHLRPLLRNVTEINKRFVVIVPTMKGIAAKAALVVKIVTGG